MAAYTPGDVAHAIVADVGSYATKIGFAGEDYPRSYFRSTVACNREEKEDSSAMEIDSPSKRTSSSDRRRLPIADIKYDYFTRPILKEGTDGDYAVMNPVERTTGLWYDNDPSQLGDNGADWDDLLQKLLEHGYSSALQSQTPNHPLLLVERSYNPPPIRQQVIECLFEELNVPAAFLGRDATLACYGCGRTTSTVVDIGYNQTTVTPVYDGYVEEKAIRRSPVGARMMDEAIVRNLDTLSSPKQHFLPLYQVRKYNKRSELFHTVARLDVARQCREAGAGASVQAVSLDGSAAYNMPHVAFELPDKQTVMVPSKMRFGVADLLLGKDDESVSQREEATAALQKQYTSLATAVSHTDEDNNDDEQDSNKHKELYSEAAAVGVAQRKKGGDKTISNKRPPFSNRHLQRACVSYLQGHLEQLTSANIPAMVCDAAFRCDRDQQASLLGNVVLAGGGACLGPTEQAVPDALREQMEAIIHTHTPGWRVKVLAPGFQERAILSWLGGSILGSLGTFDKMWISKSEYEEWGTAIVNRKCP